jgi:hypothetical protein
VRSDQYQFTKREIVVLSSTYIVQVEVGPPPFEFPRAAPHSIGSGKKIRDGNVATELRSMLTEPLEDAVLPR